MGTTRRYEVTDEEWEVLQDLFPRRSGRGRPPRDPRQILNGVMWILRSGAPWRDVPRRYGPWETVYRRFRKWQSEGVLDRILERLQLRLDEHGHIDWDLWCIDGTSIRASRAAVGGGKKGAPVSLQITLLGAPEADSAAKSISCRIVEDSPSESR